MNLLLSIVLSAMLWGAAATSDEPEGAAQPERIWVLTDQTAWTTAVIGIELGPPDEILFVARSKSPKVYHALEVLDGGHLAVVQGGGLTFHNSLLVLDSSTGESLSTVILEGGAGYDDMHRFPDGTLGLINRDVADPYFVRYGLAGNKRAGWFTPFLTIDDMHVDALGRIWMTSKPDWKTRRLDAFGNVQGVVDIMGRRMSVSPQGTLWFAGALTSTSQHDLLHATEQGVVLQTIDLPSLAVVDALSIDSQGKIWVSGQGADRIECFAPDGQHVRTVLLPGPVGVDHIATL
jgi:hypothetical protein